MSSNIKAGKLIKAGKNFTKSTSVVIGGADLSDLPKKQDILDEHLEEARESANFEAQEILEKAEAQAQEIYQQAIKDADQLKITAYEKGFETGKSEAMILIKEDFKEIVENSQQLLDVIEKERAEALEDEETRIYKVIVLIAKQLLKRDLSINPELSLEFIKEALKKLELKAEVKVILDTATAQSLHAAKVELIESIPGLEQLSIIAQNDLKMGDLIVESNRERLDFRLETQLEELSKEILE